MSLYDKVFNTFYNSVAFLDKEYIDNYNYETKHFYF